MAHGVCHREAFYALDVLCEDLNLYLGQSKFKRISVKWCVFVFLGEVFRVSFVFLWVPLDWNVLGSKLSLLRRGVLGFYAFLNVSFYSWLFLFMTPFYVLDLKNIVNFIWNSVFLGSGLVRATVVALVLGFPFLLVGQIYLVYVCSLYES